MLDFLLEMLFSSYSGSMNRVKNQAKKAGRDDVYQEASNRQEWAKNKAQEYHRKSK